ncbi:MAG TPA: hypothetical protein VK911_08845 [Vicinamibacterales bacterium]|nr:hypothetical protein [Vicinamibacterales bacterium]
MADIRPSPTPKAETSPPPGRRCPRCRVALEHERTYIARGLSGVPSFEHRYACPACDARYKWSSRDQRWREVYT